jgi:hypothetical protein
MKDGELECGRRECPPPDDPLRPRECRQENKYFNESRILCLYNCPKSANSFLSPRRGLLNRREGEL